MTLYLTFNDYPSGIYSSQVIDVIKYARQDIRKDIRLLAFVSLRNYFSVQTLIKDELPDAIVLPMFPGVRNWRRNYFLLKLYCRSLGVKQIVGRSVLATQLALRLKKNNLIDRLVYDGRGAIAAEWKEYKVMKDVKMLNQIEDLEKEVVLHSDFRIAVSHALVEYWKKNFGYENDKHVVIPCTLSSYFLADLPKEEDIHLLRKKNEYMQSDIVLIYSGSSVGWQSFDLVHDYLLELFYKREEYKLVFMSDKIPRHLELFRKFGNRIIAKWVNPHEVKDILLCGDYGLLIRETSITNYVSSPVKFAEYLACGLKVIISDQLGDYTEFVNHNNCGKQYALHQILDKPTLEDKRRIRELSLSFFMKKKYIKEFQSIFSNKIHGG